DSSQIPTLLVCRLTREHVKVALSGDGGDELFGGYPRYGLTSTLWKAAARVPPFVRRWGSSALNLLSNDSWDRLASFASGILPRSLMPRHPGEKIQKFAESLQANHVRDMYASAMSYWPSAPTIVTRLDQSRSYGHHPGAPHLADPRLE